MSVIQIMINVCFKNHFSIHIKYEFNFVNKNKIDLSLFIINIIELLSH